MALALYRWIPLKFMNEILLRSSMCAEYSSSPSSLAFWVWFLLFWDASCLEESSPWIRVLSNSLWWFLCILPSTKPPEIVSSHELEFLCSWENPNALWSSPKFSRSFYLLGEISWWYVHGTGVKVSPKFRWIWTSFAWDSTFEGWFAGCLGATGLTGLCNRSDWSVLAVRPVWLSRAAVWGVFPHWFCFSS